MYASAAKLHLFLAWPWPLTSNRENLFSNTGLHVEYLCQVSLKSLYQVRRYRVAGNRCQRTTLDSRTDWRTTRKHHTSRRLLLAVRGINVSELELRHSYDLSSYLYCVTALETPWDAVSCWHVCVSWNLPARSPPAIDAQWITLEPWRQFTVPFRSNCLSLQQFLLQLDLYARMPVCANCIGMNESVTAHFAWVGSWVFVVFVLGFVIFRWLSVFVGGGWVEISILHSQSKDVSRLSYWSWSRSSRLLILINNFPANNYKC